MAEKSYPLDDQTQQTVQRYENFRAGKEQGGYFDSDELSDIADYYLHQGQTKDCLKVLELGKKLHPDSEELTVKRARTYLVSGDCRQAMHTLDSVAQNTDYETVLLRIELLQRLSRKKEAQLLANKLYADQAAEDEDERELVCMDIASAFANHDNYDVALRWLEKGEKINPENVDILIDKADIYEQIEQNDEAAAIYQKIIEKDPFIAEVWFNYGQLLEGKDLWQQALDAYNYAYALDDEDTLTCLMRATAMFNLEQYKMAIEAYTDYCDKTNDKWQSNLMIAECYQQLKMYSEAMAYFHKSLEIYPDNWDSLVGIGLCLLEQEEYEESIDFFSQAIRIQNDVPETWVYLAEAFVELDEIEQALLAYSSSLLLDPRQPEILIEASNLLMELEEYDHALDFYLAAQQLDPETEFINLYIGIAFLFLEENLLAMAYIGDAIALNPDAREMFLELCPEKAYILDEM